MLINPADAYRLLNFTGITGVANLVGTSELKTDATSATTFELLFGFGCLSWVIFNIMCLS